VTAPLAGTLVALAAVPDPVAAGQLVGPGVAIEPPATGRLDAVAPSTAPSASCTRTRSS
jgi:phosphotransferase system IIA component